jgi:methionyl aminopeptidase
MSIESQADLQHLLEVGRIVARAIQAMQAACRPGITTGELDEVGGAVLAEAGAQAAPRLVYGFPGIACISCNDEAAHGIPGARVIQSGDLVKIDVTAERDGYFADAAVTVPVGPVSAREQKLIAAARAALDAAVAAAQAGSPLARIGTAAEAVARARGFTVVRELCGHGVGRAIHEEPQVPNIATHVRGTLTEGLVLAVEPHLTTGTGRIRTAPDGWTLRTTDGRPVANFEHTIVITKGRPLLVTAA